MNRTIRLVHALPVLVSCALIGGGGALAADPRDPHPAAPPQGASPPHTQTAPQASGKADETMSEPAPRPLPGKDAAPGPATDSPKARSRKANETMSHDAPRANSSPTIPTP